jgi:6-phosphofructokinase
MSVVGIPKTIDNDIGIIDRSFGFESAVAEAKVAIKSAKVAIQAGSPSGGHLGHSFSMSYSASSTDSRLLAAK